MMNIVKSLFIVLLIGFLTAVGVNAQIGRDSSSNVAYSPDGLRLAIIAALGGSPRGYFYVIVYDSAGNELSRITFDGYATGLAWSLDGQRLAVRGYSESDGAQIRILDFERGGEPFPLQFEFELQSDPSDMLWSPDGRFLASYYVDVTLWDTRSGAYLRTLSTDDSRNSVEDIAWHPGTGELYVLDSHNTVLVFDPTTGEQTREPFRFESPPRDTEQGLGPRLSVMALNSDGSRMAVAHEGDTRQTMYIVDTASGEILRTLTAPDPDSYIRVLRWTPDGREIAVLGVQSDSVSFWDVETGEMTRSYKSDEDLGIYYPHSFVIRPDGAQMAVVGGEPYDESEKPDARALLREGVLPLIPGVAVLVDLTR